MLEPDVLISARNYIDAIKRSGTEVEFIVVFGSQVSGKNHEWSDIDLMVVSPEFDDMKDRSVVNFLWRPAALVDSRIEPIPCGSRQWREDDMSAIVEIVRREGEILRAA